MARHLARRTRTPAVRSQSEHAIQAKFFQMIDSTGHPAAKVTLAVVNGAVGGSMRRILWFIAEGMRPGAADTLTLRAARGYHCLAIEFKKPGRTVRPNQREFLDSVEAEGGLVAVMTDAEKAFRLWAWYCGLTDTKPLATVADKRDRRCPP